MAAGCGPRRVRGPHRRGAAAVRRPPPERDRRAQLEDELRQGLLDRARPCVRTRVGWLGRSAAVGGRRASSRATGREATRSCPRASCFRRPGWLQAESASSRSSLALSISAPAARPAELEEGRPARSSSAAAPRERTRSARCWSSAPQPLGALKRARSLARRDQPRVIQPRNGSVGSMGSSGTRQRSRSPTTPSGSPIPSAGPRRPEDRSSAARLMRESRRARERRRRRSGPRRARARRASSSCPRPCRPARPRRPRRRRTRRRERPHGRANGPTRHATAAR